MTRSLDYTDQPAPPVAPKSLPRAVTIALLSLIVLAAIGTRFWRIGNDVYQLDDYWHAELSTGRGSMHNYVPLNQVFHRTEPSLTGLTGAPPWWRVWTKMGHTVHPPLYVQVLRFWRETFGESAGPTRAFAAVCSVLSVFVLFDLARRLHGSTAAALWACAIFALASPQIVVSRELRGYTLAILLLLLLADAIVSLEQRPDRPRWRLLAIALLALLAMLTHYFVIFVLAALGLYALLRLRGRTRIGVATAMVVAGIAFAIIWGPQMLEQRRTLPGSSDEWIYDWPDGHAKRVWTWAASTPLRMLFEPRLKVEWMGVMGAGLFVIPLIFLRRRPDLLIWTLWLWCAVGGLIVMDLARGTKHLYHVRYSVQAGPAVYGLLAAMLLHLGNRWVRVAVPAVCVLACALSVGSDYEEPRRRYDQLARDIDRHMQPGDVVAIYTRPGHWMGYATYLCISHESRNVWPVLILDRLPQSTEVLAELRRSPGVWLLRDGSHPEPTDAFGPDAHGKIWLMVPNVAYATYVQFDSRATTQPAR